jgi:DNA-binding transcriptional LysR family regulator
MDEFVAESFGLVTYNPASFDLVTMHLVVACFQTGTLCSAAKKFNLVPGAASRRIRNLEQALGCQLFNRNAKGMMPTLTGKTLLPHALALVKRMVCLVGELTEMRNH